MGYVDELLSAHMALAAELEAEPAAMPSLQGAVRRRVRGDREQTVTESGAAGTAGEERREAVEAGGQTQEERGAAALLQQMRRLEEARARASLRAAQMQSIQTLQQAQQTQGVQPSAMRHSRYEGGLGADFLQTLETAGVSGVQTQRSMQEISRFFERDARRYGG